MALKKISPLFIIALGLSLLINTLLVFAFSKARFFDMLVGINYFVTATISQEQPTHEELKQTKDLLKDSSDNEEEVLDDSSNVNEHYAFADANVKKSQEILQLEKAESVFDNSDIRLEVPPLHGGLLRGARLFEDKAEDNKSGMILLKHNKERLQYDLYWIGVYVGRAQLSAERTLTDITITSEVHSAQFISNFYRVQDYARSVVLGGRPHNFRIKQIEGKYKSDKETFFNYDHGMITFVDYLKNKQMEHSVKDRIYWDVISGFYYLRSMPVIDTDRIFVDVFDSNKFIRVQIVILGRETIELRNGREADTIKAKVVFKSEGLFQKIGDILIWLSDDVDRVPLRVETKVPVGKVTAELRDIKVD